MLKEVIVKEKIAFCDYKNCEKKATEFNEKLDKDYCYSHAIKIHKCKLQVKYRFVSEYDGTRYCVEKKIGCIEENTFCNKGQGQFKFKKFAQQSYGFGKLENIAKFVFDKCEEIGALKNGYDDFGKKTVIVENKMELDKWAKILKGNIPSKHYYIIKKE